MAGKGEVAWTDQGELRVRVTAVPERGKANDAVIGLLTSRLDVPQREVRIGVGMGSQRKLVELPLSRAEVARRLESPAAP